MANDEQGPSLVWEGVELPRVSPSLYRAVCVEHQGPVWVRAFNRWSVRLGFSLLDDGTIVSAFFNMGNDRAKPRVGRRSRFYAVWAMANGGPPYKGQELALSTFTEPGLAYVVQVEDALSDGKGSAKPEELVYSRVSEVIRVEGSRGER